MFEIFRQLRKFCQIHKTLVTVVSICVINIITIILIYEGYQLDWTGFGGYLAQLSTKSGNFQRAKTLWDWMQLLIVPIALAVVAFFLNFVSSRREQGIAEKHYISDREISLDNQNEELLQQYFDRMSDLLLQNNLRKPSPGFEDVQSIARARTLIALSRLNSSSERDPFRKRNILQFLYETGLSSIDAGNSALDLREADLSGANLRTLNLDKINLTGVDLSRSDLRGANLINADLSKAILNEANLYGANLKGANLSKAKLSGANLSGANLSGANLSGANLSGANLFYAQLVETDLRRAKLLKADLSLADLSEADLSLADLSEVVIKSANLRKAILHKTNLTQVDLNFIGKDGVDLSEAILS